VIGQTMERNVVRISQQPFLSGKRCVTSPKTAAKETIHLLNGAKIH